MKLLVAQAKIGTGTDVAARDDRVAAICVRLDETLSRMGVAPALILLPELCTIEYAQQSFVNLVELAETETGQSVGRFATLARKYDVAISFGLPIIDKDKIFISNIVVGKDGELIARYDKVHLAQIGTSYEKNYFSPGRAFSAFTLEGYRFGVLICYDFRFPGYVQSLVTRYDLDVLLHPVAFTRDETFQSWHHFAITRALENQVYFISVNRAGDEWGNSLVCPPWIDENCLPEQFGNQEEFRLITLERERIIDARKNIPLRSDRLPDYRTLK